MKNKILLLCALVLIGVIFFTAWRHEAPTAVIFPPTGIDCYDSFVATKDNQYEDEAYNLPHFNIENITHFRCANGRGFNEYEINGTDVEGHTFYVHKSEGGIAASGADGYNDFCYIQDGVMLKSHMVKGRSPVIEGDGTCEFGTHNYNIAIESEYGFTK